MNYSGIIFDLDGTLLNTIDDLADSMNFVLKQHGFPEHSTEKYKYFVGNGMRMLVERSLPEDERYKKKIDQYLAEIEKEYSKRLNNLTRPYEGINELLDTLRNLGVRMFVLSNKPHPFTKKTVDTFFISDRFDLIYGARTGIPKKPDPYSALEISKLSGIPPSAFLYLGDSGVDMETANKAGMYAVGASWGFRKENELWEYGAKAVINFPMELIPIITKK
jgi:phosphoglycolate phosphatase